MFCAKSLIAVFVATINCKSSRVYPSATVAVNGMVFIQMLMILIAKLIGKSMRKIADLSLKVLKQSRSMKKGFDCNSGVVSFLIFIGLFGSLSFISNSKKYSTVTFLPQVTFFFFSIRTYSESLVKTLPVEVVNSRTITLAGTILKTKSLTDISMTSMIRCTWLQPIQFTLNLSSFFCLCSKNRL